MTLTSIRTQYLLLSLLASFVAGQALHWFVGGQAQAATPARNAAVVLQALLSTGVAGWCWWRGRRG